MSRPKDPYALYRKITEVLRNRIRAGDYGLGERIPPEPALCDEYGVSRTTIRQAVRQLVAEGILDTRQGQGTYVVALPTSSSEEMFRSRRAERFEWKYISSKWIEPSIEYAAGFGMSPEHKLYSLIRLRMKKGKPIAVTRYFTPEQSLLEQPPSKEELNEKAFDEILSARGIRPLDANIAASLTFLTETDAKYLEQAPGTPSLVTERVNFNQLGRPVRLSRSIMHPEHAQLFWSIKDAFGAKGVTEDYKFSVWTRPKLRP